MPDTMSSGDFGFYELAGHAGSVLLTWKENTVVEVKCSFGDHRTCKHAPDCELYNRQPIGYTRSFPAE